MNVEIDITKYLIKVYCKNVSQLHSHTHVVVCCSLSLLCCVLLTANARRCRVRLSSLTMLISFPVPYDNCIADPISY